MRGVWMRGVGFLVLTNHGRASLLVEVSEWVGRRDVVEILYWSEEWREE